MQEMKCPKCGEVFLVDESGYAAIVKQVRDKEFERELHARHEQFAQEKEAAVALAKADIEKQVTALQEQLKTQEAENRLSLREQLSEKTETITQKDAEIAALKAQLDSSKDRQALAVTQATAEKDKEIAEAFNK